MVADAGYIVVAPRVLPDDVVVVFVVVLQSLDMLRRSLDATVAHTNPFSKPR